jgi:drug/metabolite transporter (DMT)-like permease
VHTLETKEKLEFELKIYFNKKKRENVIAYIALFLAILGWGLSGSFVDFGLDSLPPLPFLFLRFLTASIVFTPYLLISNFQTLVNLLKTKWVWGIAFFETLGLSFQYLGQETVPAGLAILISLLFVVIVPILAIKLLNEQYTRLQFVGTIIALLGVSIIFTNGNIGNFFLNMNIGILILLGSALFYSLYLIYSSKYSTEINKSVDPIALFYIVSILVTLFSGIFAMPSFHANISFNNSWEWIILLAIFSTIIPFIGYFIAIKYISANIVSLLLLLQVIVPIVIDAVIVGVNYDFSVFLGGILILFAMVVVITKSNKEQTDFGKLVNFYFFFSICFRLSFISSARSLISSTLSLILSLDFLISSNSSKILFNNLLVSFCSCSLIEKPLFTNKND